MRNEIKLILMIIVASSVIQFNILANDTQTTDEYETITPDLRIQAQINHVFSIEGGLEEFFIEISKLKEMGDFEHLLQQCIYSSANTKRRYNRKEITSSDMEQTVAGDYVIIMRGLFGLDEKSPSISSELAQHAINAVVPYLGTKDPELKEELHSLLETIGYQNYSEYETYIEKRKDNPPLTLIKYMYGEATGKALLSLMRVYMKEDGEKEKIIQLENAGREFGVKYGYPPGAEERFVKVKEALNELSKYKEWWVRLYVVETMCREPRFMSQEILDRLKEDKHPLISEALNRDRIPPEIEIIEAPGEDEYIHNPRPSFNISCRDNQSGIGEVKVRLNGEEITEGLSITDGKLFYQPTTALKDNAYKLDIEVKDKAENTTKRFILFTIDTRSSK